MKLRTILLGLAALFVAFNAAYFSVLGLSKLFAGAALSVIIMASSLELAKIITASFLYNYWNQMNKILRTYLMVGVFVLITITSAGIYGFLTSAYQTTADQLGMLDKKIELVEAKKERFEFQYNEYAVEKKSLQQTITELSKGLSNNVIQYKDRETGEIITTTSSATRKVLTSQLNDNKEQRDKISVKMEVLSDSITSLDLRALEIRSTDEVAGEVGPLKYLAKITGQPMDTIVNWFALFIIFVFDPLAVTLIVAFNVAMKVDKGIEDKDEIDTEHYKVYGEEEEEDEWDGFFDAPKSYEEKEKIRKAKEEGDKIVKKYEDGKAWKRLFGDEDIEPNDDLKEAARKFEEFLDEHKKEEQEQHIVDIIEADEKDELYDTTSSVDWDSLEDSNLDIPLTQTDIINDSNGVKDDFTCYEIHRPNIPDGGCSVQCKECADKEEKETINDIEVVDEEIIVPVDLNQDGIITPDEQRVYYETVGWKSSYQNKPYYHHPWFNWDIADRWINDPQAVDFWKHYRGGSQSVLDQLKKYPTDFSKKSY